MEKHSPSETLLDKKLRLKEDCFLIVFGDGTEVPCRTLTYGEYRAYRDMFSSGHIDAYIIWDDIYKKVVLDKTLRDNPSDSMRAGIPDSVARAIYKLSAPQDYQDLIESFKVYRLYTNDLEEQIKMLICHSFPGYKLSDLDDCSFNTLMRLLAGAEFIMKSKDWLESGEGFQFSDTSKAAPENGTISNRELAQHNRVVTRG